MKNIEGKLKSIDVIPFNSDSLIIQIEVPFDKEMLKEETLLFEVKNWMK